MTTITITLPDDLAKQAEEKGLLSQTAIESYVRDRLQDQEHVEEGEMDFVTEELVFDPCLEGLVNPAIYRKGKILGDIIGPFHEEWGEGREDASWDVLFAALDRFPKDFMADGRNQPESRERENS